MMLPASDPAAHAVGSARTIKAGDLVVVYEGYNSMKYVYVDPKASFANRYATFFHRDWIGRPYGCKVTGRGGGWVYLFAPTPELWTGVLKHRTQILYIADISMVLCTYLDLRPGCVVLESGTGSGSLTHSLCRAVAPGGHVHTFEFHQQRSEDARKEFEKHGLGGFITVTLRNIEEDKFPDSLHGKADAVFLDLPGPWKVVESVARCLKPDGRFCSFSPCIEQVQKTCEAMDANGFTDIQTYECLLREYEVREETLTTDFEPKQRPPRKAQPGGPGGAAGTGGKKRRRDGEGAGEAGAAAAAPDGEESAAAAAGDAAEATVEQGAGDAAGAGSSEQGGDAAGQPAAAEAGANGSEAAPAPAAPKPPRTYVTAKPNMEARGHTGYLTFGRKFVV